MRFKDKEGLSDIYIVGISSGLDLHRVLLKANRQN